MRVLVIHNIYRPYKKGGAEVVVEQFVDELKKKHDVVVLTTKPFSGLGSIWKCHKPEVSREGGVTIVRFAPINLFTIHSIDQRPFLLRILWHWFDCWNVHSWIVMRWVLNKYQPDVVWTHGMKGIGYLPMKSIKRYGSRVTGHALRWVLTPHSEELIYQFGYGKYPFKIGLVERLTMFFTRWFTNGADIILAPSRQIIQLHEKFGFWKKAEKVSLWPCFVEKRSLPALVKGVTRNESLPLTKGEVQEGVFTFGFIGQIEEHKGVKELVEAFNSYQEQDTRLLIAGRGSLASWVEAQAREHRNIEFFGEYRQDQLETLFSKISALVVPSLIRDNMPTVILESFAHGRPVIGSNLGGIPEILCCHFERSSGGVARLDSTARQEKSHSNSSLACDEISPLGSHLGRNDDKTTKGLLLKGFGRKDFHEAFDEIQKPDVYQRLVDNIKNWKPVKIQEVLDKIDL